MSSVRNRMRKLSSQIFAAQLAILTTTTLVGFVLIARAELHRLDSEYEARAAAIAETVAAVPAVKACMADERPGCATELQNYATATSRSAGASYVVLIDMDRVRHTHPISSQIGKQVAEPIVTRDGHVHLRIDDGKTGRSANARAPLYGPAGAMVGEVSVGLPESSVWSALWSELPSYGAWLAIALGFGALASWGLARRLKHQTFGLELDEIARLLQEREATLHGIREGVIAIGENGRVSVVNDEAQRLLQLPVNAVGARLRDLLPDGELRTVLVGTGVGQDEVVVTDDFCLVVNRMPVTLGGRPHGSVVTLRDRTEMTGLLRELDGERSLTESLRAQQHEFSNRLHAVAGLLELGLTEEALGYVTEIRGTAADFDNVLRTHIAAPQIIGLLLGKAAEASERGIELVIDPQTRLSESPPKVQAIVTIVGNLIDNAFDALSCVPAPRRVEVQILETPAALIVTVSDNGPGVPPATGHLIFQDGYTTKSRGSGSRGGLGLALVHRLVIRLNGSIVVAPGPGARFFVQLPTGAPAPAVAAAATADTGGRR